MKTTAILLAMFLLFALVFSAQPASAISLGQVDDFQNGSLQNWANGVPGYLTNLSTGGPAGAGDRYLQLTADGTGQGGRLTMFNLNQWLGNWVAQGITTLEVDLINQSSVSLSIRFAFKSQNLSNAPGYLSQAMILAPSSGWQHFSIAITQPNLIAVGGPAAYNTFFANGLGDFRIINEVGTANLNGDFVTGQLGIDNIRAVPEPSAAALLVGGLLVLGWRRFRAARFLAESSLISALGCL
ncbi:MAG: PEP-CTERM sorting domain-containing protein [Chthoniobacterales bacterium]